MDNLNTHNIASLYEAFAPEKAYALAGRLEIIPMLALFSPSIWRGNARRLPRGAKSVRV